MKMKYSLACLLAAIASVFRMGAREEVCNIASTVGTHANGVIFRSWEPATAATRYQLVYKGTAPATQAIVNVLATRPIGVVMDEPSQDETAAIRVLGLGDGTLPMIASKAIAAGVPVYTAAAGKVTDAYAATAYIVGVSLTAAAADGDLIEVMHCFPLVNAAATL